MVVLLETDSMELLSTLLKVELFLFSCPEPKLFFIFMNFPCVKRLSSHLIGIPIFCMTVSRKSELGPNSLQKKRVRGLSPGSAVSTQTAVLYLQNITNEPCSVIGPPGNESSKAGNSVMATLLTKVTCQRALPPSLQINVNSYTIFTSCRTRDDFI